jgi:integrase/recombinase XerD
LVFHGMRREELCGFTSPRPQSRQGRFFIFRVRGKRGKLRFVPVHALAQRLIEEYMALAGLGSDTGTSVFRPVTNNRTQVCRSR